MYYFIYETTNIINGKKYRGYHGTSDINDGYLGSGPILKKAIKKYGKENFVREILEFCSSIDEVAEKEKIYVNKEWVKNKETYNLQIGGRYGHNGNLSDDARKKIIHWNKKNPLNEESKKKQSDQLKKIWEDPEKSKKLREGNKGKNKGRKHSPESCKNMSESHKGPRKNRRKQWILISPDGEIFTFFGSLEVSLFCYKNNISFGKINQMKNKGVITINNAKTIKTKNVNGWTSIY